MFSYLFILQVVVNPAEIVGSWLAAVRDDISRLSSQGEVVQLVGPLVVVVRVRDDVSNGAEDSSASGTGEVVLADSPPNPARLSDLQPQEVSLPGPLHHRSHVPHPGPHRAVPLLGREVAHAVPHHHLQALVHHQPTPGLQAGDAPQELHLRPGDGGEVSDEGGELDRRLVDQ